MYILTGEFLQSHVIAYSSNSQAYRSDTDRLSIVLGDLDARSVSLLVFSDLSVAKAYRTSPSLKSVSARRHRGCTFVRNVHHLGRIKSNTAVNRKPCSSHDSRFGALPKIEIHFHLYIDLRTE
jgi:hypothetical protein